MRETESMLSMSNKCIPIIKTSPIMNEGIEELANSIDSLMNTLKSTDELNRRRRDRARDRILEIIRCKLTESLLKDIELRGGTEIINKVADGTVDPFLILLLKLS